MGKRSQTIRNKRKIKVDRYDNDTLDTREAKKILTKGFSREIKFTIVSIFIVTIVMISSAFALFSSVQKSENENTIIAGTFRIEFQKTADGMANVINLNGAYPISDEDGLKNSPYSFVINNTGTVDAGYKIKILDDQEMINQDGCSNNQLSKSRIKVSVDGRQPFILDTTKLNEYVIDVGTLPAQKSKKHSIRIWIDESSGNEVLGRHYHGKILVEAQNTSTLCSIKSGSGENIGDEIICGTESFYVINSNTENIKMIAKYNLNVGGNINPEGVEAIQDKDCFGYKEGFPTYGSVAFSSNNYWASTTGNEFIYNENSNIYQYLANYQTYLRSKARVASAEVSLMSLADAQNLGCNLSIGNCSTAYPFVYQTSYWLGSGADVSNVYSIGSNNTFIPSLYNTDQVLGVRPVVTITKGDIKS